MTPKTTLLSRPGRHPQRLTLAKITIPGRERTAIYLYAYERTDSNQDEPTSFHVSKTEEWISSNREEIEFVAPFDRIPSSIGFSLKACTPFWYLAAYYFLTKQVIDRVNTPGNTNFLEELKVVFGQLTRPIEKLRAVPASHSVLGSPPRWEERAGYSAEANRRAKSIEASRGKKRAVESESGTTERGGTLHRKPGSRSKTPVRIEALLLKCHLHSLLMKMKERRRLGSFIGRLQATQIPRCTATTSSAKLGRTRCDCRPG